MKMKVGNHLLLLKHRKLQHGVVGIRSDCNNRHVFFLDLDNINPAYLAKRIVEMQARFKMGTVYLCQSSPGNYHLLEFTMRSFGETIDIQRWFGDEFTHKYQIFAVVRGYWVLRCSPKVGKGQPELVYTYPAAGKADSFCNSHYVWFCTHYGIDIDSSHSKPCHEVRFDQYPTVEKKEEELI